MSLELPWRDNQPFKSCIPAGTYPVIWNRSPAFGREMYLVTEVPGRSGIRWHPGSYAGAEDKGFRSDFLGCSSLGFGTFWCKTNQQVAVHSTRAAMDKFEKMMEGQPFMLTIKQDFTNSI